MLLLSCLNHSFFLNIRFYEYLIQVSFYDCYRSSAMQRKINSLKSYLNTIHQNQILTTSSLIQMIFINGMTEIPHFIAPWMNCKYWQHFPMHFSFLKIHIRNGVIFHYVQRDAPKLIKSTHKKKLWTNTQILFIVLLFCVIDESMLVNGLHALLFCNICKSDSFQPIFYQMTFVSKQIE